MEGAFETAAGGSAEDIAAPPLRTWQRPIPAVGLVMVLVAVASLLAWSATRPSLSPPATVTRFPMILPEGDVSNLGHGVALSPDGRTIVYAAERDDVEQLFARTRDQTAVRVLPGTEDGTYPFFSPDGAWVGFFADDSLMKVALAGGPPVTLCLVGNRRGATWGPDDTIVFASDDSRVLMQVQAAGGEPRPLTVLQEDDRRHHWPRFLPDGTAVVYTINRGRRLGQKDVGIASLDTGEQRTLVPGVSGSVTASGHFVFARGDTLWAAPFDTTRLTVSGEPAPVVEGVQVNTGGWAHYTVADDGTLVYLPGRFGGGIELAWVDLSTREETLLAAPAGSYAYPRVSPDGTRVSVDSLDQQVDIWIWNLPDGPLSRLTFDAAGESYGEWTPDGERVIFSSNRAGGIPGLFWRAADGTGEAQPLGESQYPRYPQAVAPDGSVLEVRETVDGNHNLVTVSLSGDPVSQDLLVTEFNELNVTFSPDGRWFAYQSAASGYPEVYVRPFPDADAALHQISTDGGFGPRWSPDGTEVFYINRDFRFACPGWLRYTSESRRAHEILFVAPSSSSRGRHLSPR